MLSIFYFFGFLFFLSDTPIAGATLQAFNTTDCPSSALWYTGQYPRDQCFTFRDSESGKVISSSVTECSYDFTNPGSWLTRMYYTDYSCKDILQVQAYQTHVCHKGPSSSNMYINPMEYSYLSSGNCTGPPTSVHDISDEIRHCSSESPGWPWGSYSEVWVNY
jgi:hypothetical protein